MGRRGLALAAIAAGLVVVVLAQRLAPLAGPPLYDGVPLVEPYVWLSPPPGQPGGAQPAHDTETDMSGGFGVFTAEQPPQAQILIDPGILDIPDGTTSVTVSVTPVPPPAVLPADGAIAGNVYDIEATDQNGAPIAIAAGSQVTVVIRGPAGLSSARIEIYAGGQWTAVETDPVGVPDMYTTIVGELGEFALVKPGAGAPAVQPTPSPAATSAASAGTAASGGPVESPAGSQAASPVPGPTTRSSLPGSVLSTSSGAGGAPALPWSQIAAVAIGALVVLAAGFVLLRPVKPPAD